MKKTEAKFRVKQKELGWILAEKDKYGILFLDIDNSDYDDVEKEVKKIQSRNRLGNATTIKSSLSKHWHIYFFNNWIKWKRIIKIIDNCPIVDKQFKEFKNQFPFIRARLTNLPKQEPIIIKSKWKRKGNVAGNLLENNLRCFLR